MTTQTASTMLDDLNLVTDNDFAATCARLRVVIDAGADAFAEDATERSDDPGSVPMWQARAATALRDWYRDHLTPVTLDAAEKTLRADWRSRRTAPLPGDSPLRERGSFDDSLPNAAALMLRQVMSSAIDGIPWVAWLDVVGEMAPHDDSDDGHAWLFDAFRILPTLRTENPNEPEGTWSAYDLACAAFDHEGSIRESEIARVAAALDGMEYYGVTASRHVGGTSGSLHHLKPAATQIARD